MTLDEAIKHCEDVAEDRCGCAEDCVNEHRQLAEWLKELRERRAKDEPTCSKMEQVDEPQISPSDCKTCKHDLWSTPRTCGKCSRQEDGKPSMYEPKDELQTERSE